MNLARNNPRKLAALEALARGPLELGADGWRSDRVAGVWNSHSIVWMSWQQWCAINGCRATITRAGREYLQAMEAHAA